MQAFNCLDEAHPHSPGQNTGMSSLSLFQGIFPGFKPRSSTLQVDSLPAEPQGKSKLTLTDIYIYIYIYMRVCVCLYLSCVLFLLLNKYELAV